MNESQQEILTTQCTHVLWQCIQYVLNKPFAVDKTTFRKELFRRWKQTVTGADNIFLTVYALEGDLLYRTYTEKYLQDWHPWEDGVRKI